MTASPAPVTIGIGSTSGALVITVGAGATPGDYPFTVRARASGLAEHSVAATLTITAKPAITITLSPATERVPHTGAATFRAVVSRVNFTGAVTLALSGVPVEVTPRVTQSADTFTVSVAVGLNAFEGSHPIVVTASGSGVVNATATYTLVVIPRPAGITLAVNGSGTVTTPIGGLTASATIIVRRTEYLGEVALAVDGALPTGVTATVAPSPTTGNSIVASFAATAQATPGTYPITLKGTGPGIPDARVSLTLVVTPFASIASLTLSRSNIVVAQAGTGTTSASIVRSNFAGPVTFAVNGLPPEATVTLGTNPTSSNGMAITVTVAANAIPGTYAATVTASAAGIATVSVPLTLTITLGGQSGNTTFQFCGTAAELPIWFGAQPGARWQQILPSAPNTYSFDVGNTAGAAWVTQDAANQTTLTVFYGTQAELAAEGARRCVSPSGKRVTGTVSGLGASDRASVFFGTRSATALTAVLPAFALTGLPDGVRDLVALRTPGSALSPDRIVLQRGLNPASNTSLGAIDFAAAGVAPVTHALAVQGLLGGEQVVASSFLHTTNGTSAPLGTSSPTRGATVVVGVAPPASLAPGDRHSLAVVAGVFSGSALTAGRTATTFMATVANPALALGAALAPPDVATASLQNGVIRVRTRYTVQPDYDKLWISRYGQVVGGTTRNVVVTASGGYHSFIGGPQASIPMPDLAATAGWKPEWGMQNNILISWTVSVFGWSGVGSLTPLELDGTTIRGAFLVGSYTPP